MANDRDGLADSKNGIGPERGYVVRVDERARKKNGPGRECCYVIFGELKKLWSAAVNELEGINSDGRDGVGDRRNGDTREEAEEFVEACNGQDGENKNEEELLSRSHCSEDKRG